jgi:hypothetical protein
MHKKSTKPTLGQIFEQYSDKSLWINLPRKRKKAMKKKRVMRFEVISVVKSTKDFHTITINPISPIS